MFAIAIRNGRSSREPNSSERFIDAFWKPCTAAPIAANTNAVAISPDGQHQRECRERPQRERVQERGAKAEAIRQAPHIRFDTVPASVNANVTTPSVAPGEPDRLVRHTACRTAAPFVPSSPPCARARSVQRAGSLRNSAGTSRMRAMRETLGRNVGGTGSRTNVSAESPRLVSTNDKQEREPRTPLAVGDIADQVVARSATQRVPR